MSEIDGSYASAIPYALVPGPDHDELNLIISGLAVQRFHTVPSTHPESVGHHSALVCHVLLHLMAPTVPSQELLVAALRHDLAEAVTGDIPGPTKRALLDLRAELAQFEDAVLEAFRMRMPTLTGEEAWALKMADNLAGAIQCLQELACGNQLIVRSFRNYMAYITAMSVSQGSTRAHIVGRAASLSNRLWESFRNVYGK
jgi:5'-deoxynucleotidase YfbR-like HD superfamily hydrolase